LIWFQCFYDHHDPRQPKKKKIPNETATTKLAHSSHIPAHATVLSPESHGELGKMRNEMKPTVESRSGSAEK
jgi:hypothetical protein